MYRCIPEDGSKPHKFTAPLPRDHVHSGNQDCAECRELRGIHRGETTIARRHSWSTRIVVRGLEKLAQGETYTSVSQWALRLEGTGKRRRTPPGGDADTPVKSRSPGKRWHIAADWCEAFSPVIWEDLNARLEAEARHARAAGAQIVWLIDSTSFGGRRRAEDGQNGGSPSERFALLSVAEQFVGGTGVDQRARLRLVRALPNRTSQAWQLTLAEVGYAPDVVVSDADQAQLGAAFSLFNQVAIIPCLFHLRRALEDSLADLPQAFLGTRHERRLRPELREHLGNMSRREHVRDRNVISKWWDDWTDLHIQAGIPIDRLARQRDRYENVMLGAASLLQREPNLPLSVGALEAMQNTVVRPTIARRASGLANIERTNALLDLIVAGQRFAFDDLNRVADLLRADALIDHGHSTPLRWVEDPQPKRATYSSLRDPALVLDLAEQRGFL